MKTWHILVLVLLVAIGGFYIVPTVNTTRSLRSENIKLQKTLQGKIEELQTLNQVLQKTKEQKKSVLSLVPIDNGQEFLLRDLQKIAQQTGFGFNGLQFFKGQNSAVGLPELSINFSTEGQKSQFKKFLLAIENNQRFLGMNRLDVQTDFSAPANPKLRFNVSLYSFYQKEQ